MPDTRQAMHNGQEKRRRFEARATRSGAEPVIRLSSKHDHPSRRLRLGNGTFPERPPPPPASATLIGSIFVFASYNRHPTPDPEQPP
jgi:hypothetical protein